VMNVVSGPGEDGMSRRPTSMAERDDAQAESATMGR